MQSDLVFDIGAHRGEDTAHYLGRGFRVVAVEANPQLGRALRERFSHFVDAGQLEIEATGIAASPGQARFLVNPVNTEFSSFERSWAERGATPTEYEVPCITMSELFGRYGVPYFLKIDIEGNDRLCLEAIDPSDLPSYVSVEAHRLDYLAILWSKGYRRFRVVDQTAHGLSPLPLNNERPWNRGVRWGIDTARRIRRHVRTPEFPSGTSGPMPDQADRWADLETVAYAWLHNRMGRHHRGSLNRRSWFDFHAAAEE